MPSNAGAEFSYQGLCFPGMCPMYRRGSRTAFCLYYAPVRAAGILALEFGLTAGHGA